MNVNPEESPMSGTQTPSNESPSVLQTLTSENQPQPLHLTIAELLRDDAPLLALLSVRENPLLLSATQQELNALVMKCRMTAATPAKQKSLLAEAGGSAPKKKKTSTSPQRLAQLKKFADED
jgi:hypothetical protein